ncbi:MAG TPA: CDP-alcohol phosphatidyltransferase family protein [Actinomycetota bacterium]|nr:CDP-alcohol phosphatidyltransferase family protein [Actinomycetota bacterium]
MRQADRPRERLLTLPNLLSFGRIAATPLLAWLILTRRNLPATVLVAVMGISDFLDGYIARATGTVSDVGVVIDPVSDRIAVITSLVTLMVVGSLPLWLGLPVLAREGVVSAAFLVLARRGFGKPKVRLVGKTATFALLASLPLVILGGGARLAGLGLFAAGGVVSFIAVFRYWQDIAAWLKSRAAEGAQAGPDPTGG